jgi:hypothetical protein
MPTNVNQVVARALSAFGRVPDGTQNPGERTGRYGERYEFNLVPTKHMLSDEGGYFVTTNPTPGTTVAAAVQAAFSDTVAAFVIQNTDSLGGKRVYLDYIKLLPTVAPATSVSAQYALKLEPSSQRAPTAGQAQISPVNTNGDDGTKPVTLVQAFTGGAFLTVPASSAASRLVGRGCLRGSIPVVGDELCLQFGAVDPASGGAPPATASHQGSTTAPIIIAPGGSLTVHLWFPSNATTGLSAEYEIGHWER